MAKKVVLTLIFLCCFSAWCWAESVTMRDPVIPDVIQRWVKVALPNGDLERVPASPPYCDRRDEDGVTRHYPVKSATLGEDGKWHIELESYSIIP